MTSITIPKSVTSIGKKTFSSCYGLTSIVVEDGNTVYDSHDNCNAIIETATGTLIQGCKTTIIPNSITSIDDYAFHYCTGLTSINIPGSVRSIEMYAFDACRGITSITIPNSVRSIEYGAFSDCSGITSVKVESATPPTCQSSVFAYCTALTEILVPSASVNAYKRATNWSTYADKIKGF